MTAARAISLALAVAALAAGLTAPASAQVKHWPSESAPKPLKARPVVFPPYAVRTLPNGLRVIVVEHHEQPMVNLRLLVGAGSAQDPGTKPGVASLVAALLDQGSARHSARGMADAVDAIGGDLRTGAGTDLSYAYITVLKDGFATGLDLLSEVVRTPAFEAPELERVRQQALSALTVAYDDPGYLASSAFDRLVYGFHPYGNPGQGTPGSLAAIDRGDLVAFHERYFAPNNAILAIVGDVSPDAAFAAVERVFGPWARRAIVPVIPIEPPPPERRIIVIDKPGAVQTAIRAGHLSIRRGDRNFNAVDLAVRLLGGEGANRLQQVLRVELGLTYSATADLRSYRSLGDIVAATDTRADATAQTLRALVDEFTRLRRDPAGERELANARSYITGNFVLSLETPDSIATQVLTAVFYGLSLKDIESYCATIDAITPDELERATRTALRPDRLTIVLVGDAAQFLPHLRRQGFKQVEVVSLRQLNLMAADLGASLSSTSGGAASPFAGLPFSREIWNAAKAVATRAVAAAGGQAALAGVKSIKAVARTATFAPGGRVEASAVTTIALPSAVRVDATLPSKTVITQVYDAGSAWVSDQHGPRDAPPTMKTEMALALRRDWMALLREAMRDKVMGRRLPDERGVGGRLLHVIEFWDDGLTPVRLACDAESGRLVSLSYEASGPGGSERVTESYDDFRVVDGLSIPFTTVVRRAGVPVIERVFTEIRLNEPVDPATFRKPR
jgi:zinc protease